MRLEPKAWSLNDEFAAIERAAWYRWEASGQQGEPEDYQTDDERRRLEAIDRELERQEAEAIEEAKQRGIEL